ncbi:MAG: hypothetical protein PHR87_00665 [Sulfurospirillaceae bacterium]|nr:hypothetical protein [Sulfurospirillaceae bacterium]
MKHLLTKVLVVTALAAPSIISAQELKGLNVLITSSDAQTQMMGMVLSSSVLNDQKKAVNITLCGPAGALALKDSPAVEVKKPDGSTAKPKMVLQGLMKAGAIVQICPLYLPNVGKDANALVEGILVAKPPMVAKGLTDPSFNNISF